MPPKPKLNVQSFPRPPLLEKTPRHVQVRWQGQTIADTKDAYWVLETYHPPTYYLPRASLSPSFPLTQTSRSTYCEYKGVATYHSINLPSSSTTNSSSSSSPSARTISNRIWSYENPTSEYAPLKGYLSFYVGPWECVVDGEVVKPQPGDFYGGWTTSELTGIIKGDAATRHL